MGLFDFWKRMFTPPQEDAGDAVIMIACSSCKQKFPMAEMQYDTSGESLACASCAAKGVLPKQHAQPAPQGLSSRQYIPPGYQQRAPYICSDCGYKFTRHASYKASLRCTYCSSANVRPHAPMQAQDVLNHAENPQMLYKY